MDSRKVMRDREAQNNAAFAAHRKASMQKFVTHSFRQQQAALNLALLAKKEQDIGLTEGKIDGLLLALTVSYSLCPTCIVSIIGANHVKQAEAPQEVITAMTNSAPPPVAADERAQLLKLQELIQRRLNAS
jgi:hypothetical protein